MCELCGTIRTELMLSEIERELILAEADAGDSVAHATRKMLPGEIKAKVKFTEIEALTDGAAARAQTAVEAARDLMLTEIIDVIFAGGQSATSAQLSEKLTQLMRTQPPGVVTAVEQLSNTITAELDDVYAGAAAIVLDEAKRQGVDVGKLKPKTAPAAEKIELADGSRFNPFGLASSAYLWQRLTQVLQSTYLNPATLAAGSFNRADVEKVIAEIPVDGAVDQAKQAINEAHGAGRYDQAGELDPQEIWASELLDGATCGPCARVDGKEYATLEEARVEYETGGYGACLGGARCRGTLVMIYGSPTAPPTDEPPTLPVLPDPPKPPTGRRRAAPAPEPEPSTPAEPLPERRTGQPQKYSTLAQLPRDEKLRTADPLLVAADTNPGRLSAAGLNYRNNCSSVVQAYEMQRRGFAVKAGGTGTGRYHSEYVADWWSDADGNPAQMSYVGGRTIVQSKKMLDDYISAQGAGARGFVALHWTQGGGHVFSWENVDGKPTYIEAQVGPPDAGERHFGRGSFKPSSLRVVRIDDKTPNDKMLVALETRPAGLDEEARAAAAAAEAGRVLTSAEKKFRSRWRMRMVGGKKTYLAPEYRKGSNGRWQQIPESERQQMLAEFLRERA